MDYCVSDVNVLCRAVCLFTINSKSKLYDINPMDVGITTASYVKFLLMQKCIKNGDIGIISELGFAGVNQSELAMKFILWLWKSEDVYGMVVMFVTRIEWMNETFFKNCRLCRSCTESGSMRERYDHSLVSERVTGEYTSMVLNKALSLGFTRFGIGMTGGFFAPLIKPLLKMKHEASGYPDYVKTAVDEDAYIEAIKEHDGVVLDKDSIKKNPPIRLMAKTTMNSTWGKFPEDPQKSELKLFYTLDWESQKKFRKEAGCVSRIFDLPNQVTMIIRRPESEYVTTKRFANIVIGIVTTSMARLRLYEALEKLELKRLLYCNTDSVVDQMFDVDDERINHQ
ncbi:unnamed protein product [Caenorhabditis angaria]|uniref:DNA-directed DNA polymerase n=1 Tax=Caenorhabditis angaria TaxID=860376 RepID=A0A9P1J1L5_9PELO|nr:unnamed protein product [Caenorhabditis angaria]